VEVAPNQGLDREAVRNIDSYRQEAAMTTKKQTVRKNLRLSQAKIDRAKKILGTKTETETIEQALDLVAFRDEVVSGLESLAGSGILRDPDEEAA
jgi:hypothetical protein